VTQRNPHARAKAALRDFALGFPEAYEELPWGHTAVKVKKRVFVFLHLMDDFLSMSVKLPVSGREALALPFASPTEYGLGKSGWVTARIVTKDKVPVAMMKAWIDESYRAVAPKKLVARLEDVEAGPTDSPPLRAPRQERRRAD
jgi:predicted DNA-binding protein (MmcQ/YjbR family)